MNPRTIEEIFNGIDKVQLNLNSALVEYEEVLSDNNQSIVYCEISCDECTSDNCDPDSLEITFKSSGDKLEIGERYDGPSNDRPTLKVKIIIGTTAIFTANLLNGSMKVVNSNKYNLNLTNGSMIVLGQMINDNEVTVGNGSVTMESVFRSGNLRINSNNGSIDVVLQEESNCKYQASVGMGQVTVLKESNTIQKGNNISGVTGDENAHLDIQLDIGSVSINLPARHRKN